MCLRGKEKPPRGNKPFPTRKGKVDALASLEARSLLQKRPGSRKAQRFIGNRWEKRVRPLGVVLVVAGVKTRERARRGAQGMAQRRGERSSLAPVLFLSGFWHA